MFTLIVLRCRDRHESRRFYEALGLTFTEEQHGKGPVHDACEQDGMVLELYPPNEAGTTQNLMLGLTLPDLDAALDGLAALGVQPKSPPKQGCCTVIDPDGNAVMLSAAARPISAC